MTWYIISLTITTYLSSDHPHYFCFLYTEVNGKYETKEIDIDTANRLMWKLKAKGWETKTAHHYNRFTPRAYDREIRWMHIDNGYRED